MPAVTPGLYVYGVVRQTAVTVTTRYFTGQHCAHGAIRVSDIYIFEKNRLSTFQRRGRFFNEHMIKRFIKPMILSFAVEYGYFFSSVRHGEYTAKIQALRFPVLDSFTNVKSTSITDHFIVSSVTELCHPFTYIFGHEHEKVYDVFRSCGKSFA